MDLVLRSIKNYTWGRVKLIEKSLCRRPRRRLIKGAEEKVEEDKVESNLSDLELELEKCMARKTRSRRVE